MDSAECNRRQFVCRTSAILVSLLLPSITDADDAASPFPPLFRPGNPSIGAEWRRRLQSDDAKLLVRLLLTTAAERLADPLPGKEARELLGHMPTQINLTDSSVQQYVNATLVKCAVFYYLPLFALAYRLSDDQRFKNRTLDWIDIYTSWASVAAGQGDIAESYAAMGTILAAQWLGDEVLGETRRKALHETWTREGAALNRWPTVVHSNNHYWFTNAGLALLVTLHPECFKDADGLRNRLIQTFRQSLPLTFSEAGEYNDGVIYAHFTLTACGLVDQALWDRYQTHLFDDDDRLHRFTEFALDTTCPDGGNLPGEHEVIRNFNWSMARPLLWRFGTQFNDHDLLARVRSTIPDTADQQRGMKLWFWFRKDLPHTGETPNSNIDWHGVFDLMWLPVPGPSKPIDSAPYSHYPHTGICIARDGMLGEKTLLYFRAGSASQKDMSDHNGFVWYPLGRRVIDTPRSDMDAWRDDTVNYFKDWKSFFGTSHAANVILVDGEGQTTTHANGWPGQGDEEWLHRGKVPTTSKIIDETKFSDGIRWTGEAQKAYPNRLTVWRRSVELRNWLNLSIRDDIETVRADAKIDWLLHSLGEWTGSGRHFDVVFDGVSITATFESPKDVQVSIEHTPFGQDHRRTTFLRATASATDHKLSFDVRLSAQKVG